jgi:hypothetical protein
MADVCNYDYLNILTRSVESGTGKQVVFQNTLFFPNGKGAEKNARENKERLAHGKVQKTPPEILSSLPVALNWQVQRLSTCLPNYLLTFKHNTYSLFSSPPSRFQQLQ